MTYLRLFSALLMTLTAWTAMGSPSSAQVQSKLYEDAWSIGNRSRDIERVLFKAESRFLLLHDSPRIQFVPTVERCISELKRPSKPLTDEQISIVCDYFSKIPNILAPLYRDLSARKTFLAPKVKARIEARLAELEGTIAKLAAHSLIDLKVVERELDHVAWQIDAYRYGYSNKVIRKKTIFGKEKVTSYLLLDDEYISSKRSELSNKRASIHRAYMDTMDQLSGAVSAAGKGNINVNGKIVAIKSLSKKSIGEAEEKLRLLLNTSKPPVREFNSGKRDDELYTYRKRIESKLSEIRSDNARRNRVEYFLEYVCFGAAEEKAENRKELKRMKQVDKRSGTINLTRRRQLANQALEIDDQVQEFKDRMKADGVIFSRKMCSEIKPKSR